ncbi:helix-turn-helix domain-containing protein, partial [Microbacterium sp. B19]|uniref:helix-turn-helix domain-containing protein n=1 Tax=Microbacterium sp. B19 TaxID=96765 RepID=UPI00195546F1
DVIVVGLIGERGREVKEFIEQILGAEGLARSVVVAAPADTPPLMRLQGAAYCTSIAEYFRDQGKDVLLIMDSLTRYAYTSAGVAAGIDLALALLEEDLGTDVARSVAQHLLVYMRRSAGQSQFSAALKLPAPRTPLAQAVAEYVANDPTRPTTVTELAAHVNVSPRHLTRVLREELGVTPSAYIASLRLELAVNQLENGRTVAESAAAAGFSSAAALRRAFVERYRTTPSAYQRRFRSPSVGIVPGDEPATGWAG